MKQIPLQQVPNQTFSAILDNNTWNFTIKTVEDISIISLNLNGVDILDSIRSVAGSFIIPSEYEENGNFIFVTANFELPFYTKFNISQALLYVGPDELIIFRAPSPIKISRSFFNPIAALPLRYSPQGYVLAP